MPSRHPWVSTCSGNFGRISPTSSTCLSEIRSWRAEPKLLEQNIAHRVMVVFLVGNCWGITLSAALALVVSLYFQHLRAANELQASIACKYAFTDGAAKAWFRPQRFSRSPPSSKASMPKHFPVLAQNGWERQSRRSAGLTRTIRLREPVSEPDALIIQDPTLLHQSGLFDGLQRQDGYVLVNSVAELRRAGDGELLAKFPRERQITVPATELALEYVGRPLPNAAAGGFRGVDGRSATGVGAEGDSREVPGQGRRSNATAAQARYELVSQSERGGDPVRQQIEGSRAVAQTVALCRPEVICAYPITPQTHIVEGLGELVKSGELAAASSSTWNRSSARCRWRSAHRRRVHEPIRRRQAKVCCSWPRRCITRRASACRL